MKIYRLDKRGEAGVSFGFEYFTTIKEARKACRDWMGDDEESICNAEGTDIVAIEVTPTKPGIMRVLKQWATHPDNG